MDREEVAPDEESHRDDQRRLLDDAHAKGLISDEEYERMLRALDEEVEPSEESDPAKPPTRTPRNRSG